MRYADARAPGGAKSGRYSRASRHVPGGGGCAIATAPVNHSINIAPRRRVTARTSELYLRAETGVPPWTLHAIAPSQVNEHRPPQENRVAYIITEPCIGTKDTACVDVCPVDCIHPRKDEPEFETAEQLFIHPDECIDCGACVPACPVEAIFALDETPEKWKNFISVNAQHFQK
jgi:ferredoxin